MTAVRAVGSADEEVERAVAAIRSGRPVVVLDDEDRECEGDLIVAAEVVTPQTMAFVVRHSSGFVCVALPADECDRLALPPMHHTNSDGFGTAYRVTVDAAEGVGTGISARDRAHTARLLARADARAADFTRPGHVVPLAARAGGVLERGGHTEAAVDLTRLAGLRPAGVLCEIVSSRDPGQMARGGELAEFAAEHGLVIITIAALAAYRRRRECPVERVTATRLPTVAGLTTAVGYREPRAGAASDEHVALVAGELGDGADVPVHVHVECVLGDVFGSARCGCATRLDDALRDIAGGGRGVVVYLRPGGHAALRALQALDAGVGLVGRTRDGACTPTDARRTAVHILRDLGVVSARPLYMPPALCAAIDELVPAPASAAYEVA